MQTGRRKKDQKKTKKHISIAIPFEMQGEGAEEGGEGGT